MNKREVERISALIFAAPLGQYIGVEGASILAAKAANERRLKDNEFLYRKGETTSSFFIVTEGRLAFVREKDADGDVSILHVLQKGDLVGEMSFIDDTPHTVSVCALGDAAVLCFKESDIKPLVTEHPKLIFDFMRAVIKRVHQTVATIGQQQSDLVDYVARGGSGRF